MTMSARILEDVAAHPRSNSATVANRLGIRKDQASAALSGLKAAGKLATKEIDGVMAYSVVGVAAGPVLADLEAEARLRGWTRGASPTVRREWEREGGRMTARGWWRPVDGCLVAESDHSRALVGALTAWALEDARHLGWTHSTGEREIRWRPPGSESVLVSGTADGLWSYWCRGHLRLAHSEEIAVRHALRAWLEAGVDLAATPTLPPPTELPEPSPAHVLSSPATGEGFEALDEDPIEALGAARNAARLLAEDVVDLRRALALVQDHRDDLRARVEQLKAELVEARSDAAVERSRSPRLSVEALAGCTDEGMLVRIVHEARARLVNITGGADAAPAPCPDDHVDVYVYVEDTAAHGTEPQPEATWIDEDEAALADPEGVVVYVRIPRSRAPSPPRVIDVRGGR